MLYRLTDRLSRAQFDAKCRAVLDAPPAALVSESPLLVLSQLQHKDLTMYLLAVKSFARRVEVGAVAVVDDGSLTPGDVEILRRHVPGIRFFALQEFRSPHCPRGGTWERLLAISELARERYVIQLDSDTLALGELPEVAACVTGGVSFVIGTWDQQDFETMAERAGRAKPLASGVAAHVQVLAEANLDRLTGFRDLRYVRGCSGFSGFARGAVSREFVEAISAEMLAALGPRWTEWGSEQVMSNIAVANAPRARVLPHPKYADCQKMRNGETVFVHFIGSCRFRQGVYATFGAALIEQLLEGGRADAR